MRDGAIVGRCGVDAFGPPGDVHNGDVHTELVSAYLRRLRVLRCGGAAAGRGRGSSSSPDGSDDSDDGGGGGRYDAAPCEECGRTYPHEHMRAVRAGGGRGDSSDSSDEQR
eukprot:175996-Chlamydomonas_euryale.AAC.4